MIKKKIFLERICTTIKIQIHIKNEKRKKEITSESNLDMSNQSHEE